MICKKCKKNVDVQYMAKNSKNDNGLDGRCRECMREKDRKRYVKHKEADADYNKKRYVKFKSGFDRRAKTSAVRRKYITKAHREVGRALVNGNLTRIPVCQLCNTRSTDEAHHEDYEKPLEVIWLCNQCHRRLHAERYYGPPTTDEYGPSLQKLVNQMKKL